MTVWKLAATMATTGMLALGSLAANAAEAIKIGDLNSYKRLPAFTIPYKNGVDLAIEHYEKVGKIAQDRINAMKRFRNMGYVDFSF